MGSRQGDQMAQVANSPLEIASSQALIEFEVAGRCHVSPSMKGPYRYRPPPAGSTRAARRVVRRRHPSFRPRGQGCPVRGWPHHPPQDPGRRLGRQVPGQAHGLHRRLPGHDHPLRLERGLGPPRPGPPHPAPAGAGHLRQPGPLGGVPPSRPRGPATGRRRCYRVGLPAITHRALRMFAVEPWPCDAPLAFTPVASMARCEAKSNGLPRRIGVSARADKPRPQRSPASERTRHLHAEGPRR